MTIHFSQDIRPTYDLLTDLYRETGDQRILSLLEGGVPSLVASNFDHWNGGTTCYTLGIEVPVHLFAQIEHSIKQIEKQILERIRSIQRTETHDFITSVVIMPAPDTGKAPAKALGYSRSTSGATWRASSVQVSTQNRVRQHRCWRDGFFRLFLSHSSTIRTECHFLRQELGELHIDAFVAHDVIEPSSDWQNEIEGALSSMEVLLALMTEDFHASKWTDQEVGWALGRQAPVFTVRCGCDPYGFLGRIQAATIPLVDAQSFASSLFEIICTDERTGIQMTAALAQKIERSASYIESNKAIRALERVCFIDAELLNRLEGAAKTNSQVYDTHNVVQKITDFVESVRNETPL